MKHVAVIGSGLIGRAWAVIFAKAGCQVSLYDTDPACREGLAEAVKAECEILHRHGLLSDISSVLKKLHISSDLSQAVQTADFIQENGPERLEVKQALFAELDHSGPGRHTDCFVYLGDPCLSVHRDPCGPAQMFCRPSGEPPHLVPLVEICGAPWTTAAVLDRAHDL